MLTRKKMNLSLIANRRDFQTKTAPEGCWSTYHKVHRKNNFIYGLNNIHFNIYRGKKNLSKGVGVSKNYILGLMSKYLQRIILNKLVSNSITKKRYFNWLSVFWKIEINAFFHKNLEKIMIFFGNASNRD